MNDSAACGRRFSSPNKRRSSTVVERYVPGDSLMFYDVLERPYRALVDGRAAQVLMGQGIRKGVRLQLQPDLDDIERCDDEPRNQTGRGPGCDYLES
ncbi:hypothetical protein CHU98_g10236 [Xylaria longipes]|nr:hypothetical protein CHU98_g10236 [Xylaria longipes]